MTWSLNSFKCLQAFDERELELVIGGLGTIDLHDWKTNTRLKHCTVETPQVNFIENINCLNFKPMIFSREDYWYFCGTLT